jgi:hypothetical protein
VRSDLHMRVVVARVHCDNEMFVFSREKKVLLIEQTQSYGPGRSAH